MFHSLCLISDFSFLFFPERARLNFGQKSKLQRLGQNSSCQDALINRSQHFIFEQDAKEEKKIR